MPPPASKIARAAPLLTLRGPNFSAAPHPYLLAGPLCLSVKPRLVYPGNSFSPTRFPQALLLPDTPADILRRVPSTGFGLFWTNIPTNTQLRCLFHLLHMYRACQYLPPLYGYPYQSDLDHPSREVVASHGFPGLPYRPSPLLRREATDGKRLL